MKVGSWLTCTALLRPSVVVWAAIPVETVMRYGSPPFDPSETPVSLSGVCRNRDRIRVPQRFDRLHASLRRSREYLNRKNGGLIGQDEREEAPRKSE